MKSCAALTCNATVKPGMLMCKPHWFQLPKQLRDGIWATWRARHISHYRELVAEAVTLIDDLPGPFDAPRQRPSAAAAREVMAIDGAGNPVRFTQGSRTGGQSALRSRGLDSWRWRWRMSLRVKV